MNAWELAMSSAQGPSSVSVRLNPFKPCPAPEPSLRVPWCEWGYVLAERPSFTLDPLFHAGTYYVQDSSAMFVGHIARSHMDTLRSGSGPVRVLDLCAAPGGKTTDLAASLRLRFGDDFELVSNEVMKQRAAVLSDNVALWGDPAVTVTSCDPSAFGSLGAVFDMIVVDAPCSGEGMFRKDSRAVAEWSEQNVQLCAARQRRILADVWPSLRRGGVLVYSTCTFEQRENDDNLQWAAENLGGDICPLSEDFEGVQKTACGYLLVPGKVPGEGQWAGSLIKTSGEDLSRCSGFRSLRPLRSGLSKGTVKGRDFVPDPDYALSIKFDRSELPCVELDRQTALDYLHRDSIKLSGAPVGYLAVCYEGHPLGFVKNLGNRCNNLLPQWRRIRMDVR